MVLLNISTLSDEEIRYIAQQEEIDGWDTLERQDLIELIQEIYEDSSDLQQEDNERFSHKYIHNISKTDSEVPLFPGVEPVRDDYNETYIHMVLKDRSWVYAYWEISENRKKELEEASKEVLIKVTALATADEEETSYEISVQDSDRSWTIELPLEGREYVLSLVARSASQEDEVLASTQKLYKSRIYFKDHQEELSKPEVFHIMVPPMTSISGKVRKNETVREIINA